MEIKSLILGLALSIGIFAVKCGAGLSYLLVAGAAGPGKKKAGIALALFVCCYLLLFGAAWWILAEVQLLDHLDMVLHLVFALVMLVWGLFLLGKDANAPAHDISAKTAAGRGWLLLMLPCPVCFSAIFCSVAFFLALYPGKDAPLISLITGFFLISFLTAAIFTLLAGRRKPEHLLGRTMVFLALYFFLTIIFVPQFSGVDRIYRLSINRDSVPQAGETGFLLFTVLLLSGGFLFGVIKKYLTKSCK